MSASFPVVFLLFLVAWISVIKGKGSWMSVFLGIMIGATATFLDPLVDGVISGFVLILSGGLGG